MRKALIGLVLLLVLLSSCTSVSSVCYYGFLGNDIYAFLYSSSKNTVYEIKLPAKEIFKWGEINQMQQNAQLVAEFCGIGADGILIASELNWKACCDIIDVMDKQDGGSSTSRMETVVKNSARLAQQPLCDAFNRLLSTDIKPIARTIAENQPYVYCLDATQFDYMDDISEVRKYVQTWMSQVLMEDNK